MKSIKQRIEEEEHKAVQVCHIKRNSTNIGGGVCEEEEEEEEEFEDSALWSNRTQNIILAIIITITLLICIAIFFGRGGADL
jgi:hypothetical protein